MRYVAEMGECGKYRNELIVINALTGAVAVDQTFNTWREARQFAAHLNAMSPGRTPAEYEAATKGL